MTVTTRAASAQLASAKMAQLNINTENTDQGMPVGKVGQRPHTAHPSQRNALGDIGNKVTGNKLGDGSKKAPIKKEIVQREIVQLANTRQTRNISKKASKPTDVDEHLLTQESTAFNFLEPTVPKTTAVPTVTVHHHPPQQQNVPAPMDISDAGEAFSKALLNVQDIDANDKDNPQLVSEYVNDIYEYMRSLERKYPVKAHYLEGQEITGKMRSILIDWLCQVHHRFHLLQETLYLTVSIIDRYLQISSVTRSKLQLVGVTAMLIASKYEEMYAPEVADFVYITDNAYSKKEILEMEQNVLRTLNFSFGRPLCLHFLRRNSKAGQVDANKHTLAKYLMELTIIEYEMVQYYPSHVAAAALCLSMKLLDNSRWNETLSHYSSYVEKELMPLMQKLASLVVKAENSKLTAVKTKYSSSKFMKISLIPELKSQTIKDLAAAATVNSS